MSQETNNFYKVSLGIERFVRYKPMKIIKIVIGALLVLATLQTFGSIFNSRNAGEAAGSLFVTFLVGGVGAYLLYSGIKQDQNPKKEE